jgi:alkylation response protein AidB-like acyl-CoA dehydrogenase
MPAYKAPLRDLQFVLHELLGSEQHYTAIGAADASPDMINAIMSEAAKFCEEVLSPLNSVGDKQGCTLSDGEVQTPTGFKAAYQQWVENGWPSLAQSETFGGQGLPESIGNVVSEMVSEANWSWGMYPGLSHGAMNTIEIHGTDEQKETYLRPLVSGEWTGTMCLTEPHCGSDLGTLKSKAEQSADGSYIITGTKIFISSGEHDMTENIVHIVLARINGAPEGTKGLSLFIVPKVLPDGTRNEVHCGALEHKMGIHGNATCVMNFDGAKGFLVGPENEGLRCMFTFMNFARLGTAMQGVASAELSFQGALAYARERLAMRALTGVKAPDQIADPIIVHPDVRRMLMTQKAFAEGGRALLHDAGFLVDKVKYATSDNERDEANELLSFLTPIAKAFLTEVGTEAANHGVQVFGGHGYIQEWGMEQIVRDNRISQLYEGTTGIQALDLLGRKVLMSQGESLKRFTRIIYKFCQSLDGNDELADMVELLSTANKEWGDITMQIGMKAMTNRDEVGGASVDYLMYSGYITLAYYWLRMAKTAQEALSRGTDEADFYQAKIKMAAFYFARILPRISAHKQALLAGVETLMALEDEQFAF